MAGCPVPPVEEELLVGFAEVSVGAFVLPDEAAFVPNVGAASLTADLFGAGLEGEELALGVGFEGESVSNGSADIIGVALSCDDFLELNLTPSGDKFLRGQWRHGQLPTSCTLSSPSISSAHHHRSRMLIQ